MAQQARLRRSRWRSAELQRSRRLLPREVFQREWHFVALWMNVKAVRAQTRAMPMPRMAIFPRANQRALVRAARGARHSLNAVNQVRDAGGDPACAANLHRWPSKSGKSA